MTLKIAVLAPIAIASVSTATLVNSGMCARRRITWWKRISCSLTSAALRGLPYRVRRSVDDRHEQPHARANAIRRGMIHHLSESDLRAGVGRLAAYVKKLP